MTSWYTTQKFQPYGCYRPEKTSAFSFGGADGFSVGQLRLGGERAGRFPVPEDPGRPASALIDRTGKMLRAVFEEAHRLGMKTCVGTESPLDIPDVVKARLRELGMNPEDPTTLQKLYEGMFLRIQRAYPIDFYWIWGHEGEIDQARFITNLQCARAALRESKAPFGLGICGWGWITQNFPALDTALPKDVVFSAISMSVGNDPVSPNFGRLEGRQKWAIPWFEDDPGLSSPQLWVGRMRKDAVDARKVWLQRADGTALAHPDSRPEHLRTGPGRLEPGRLEPTDHLRTRYATGHHRARRKDGHVLEQPDHRQ